MWKSEESNSSEKRRWKCGHMAAVNSIKNPSEGCRESNIININPPDTSVSHLRAAQSPLSTEKWLFIPTKLQYDAFVSTKYSCTRLWSDGAVGLWVHISASAAVSFIFIQQREKEKWSWKKRKKSVWKREREGERARERTPSLLYIYWPFFFKVMTPTQFGMTEREREREE